MTVSNDLHTLIHSLTRSEKRYFKLYASLHSMGTGGNTYARLFDAIARQEVYDEQRIRREFAGERFLNQLSVMKNYLFRLVLKSLRAFRAEKTVESQLRGMVQDAAVLYDKGLYRESWTLLLKAKDQAYRYDYFTILLDILRFECHVVADRTLHELGGSGVPSLYDEQEHVVELLGNAFQYHRLLDETFSIVQTHGQARSEEDRERYLAILRHPALAHPDKALSFAAKTAFHTAVSLCWYNYGDPERAFRAEQELLTLFDAHPHRIAEHPAAYLRMVMNYVTAALQLGHDRAFCTALEGIRQGLADYKKKVPRQMAVILESRMYAFELHFLVERGRTEQARALNRSIQEWLRDHAGELDKDAWLLLHFTTAYFHLVDMQYGAALEAINRVLNDTEVAYRPDVHGIARIVKLIVHYELGDYDLLDYQLRSVYRFHARRERLHRFEAIVLRCIRDMAGIVNTADLRTLLQRTHDELAAIRHEPDERQAFRFFDILAWLKSKTDGVSYADILKRQAAERSAGAEDMVDDRNETPQPSVPQSVSSHEYDRIPPADA